MASLRKGLQSAERRLHKPLYPFLTMPVETTSRSSLIMVVGRVVAACYVNEAVTPSSVLYADNWPVPNAAESGGRGQGGMARTKIWRFCMCKRRPIVQVDWA
jgi:hypothetical protein